MDVRAPERATRRNPFSIDIATFFLAAVPFPLLGTAVAAFTAYHSQETWSFAAVFVLVPVATLAIARRRQVGWAASLAAAMVSLVVTAGWTAGLLFYVVWEIGNDWGPLPAIGLFG